MTQTDKGLFVQFPIYLIYECPTLTRDDKWVLLSMMGKCWTDGPQRLSYRDIAAISGTPISLLSSFDDKQGKHHEGIIERLEHQEWIHVAHGKEVNPSTGKLKGNAQTYIYINYTHIWQENVTYCQSRNIKQNAFSVKDEEFKPVSYTNRCVSHENTLDIDTNKPVSNRNTPVSHESKPVSTSSSKESTYITNITQIDSDREDKGVAHIFLSHPEFTFLSFDDLVTPTIMVVELIPDASQYWSELEYKHRTRKAQEIQWELTEKGIPLEVRLEYRDTVFPEDIVTADTAITEQADVIPIATATTQTTAVTQVSQESEVSHDAQAEPAFDRTAHYLPDAATHLEHQSPVGAHDAQSLSDTHWDSGRDSDPPPLQTVGIGNDGNTGVHGYEKAPDEEDTPTVPRLGAIKIGDTYGLDYLPTGDHRYGISDQHDYPDTDQGDPGLPASHTQAISTQQTPLLQATGPVLAHDTSEGSPPPHPTLLRVSPCYAELDVLAEDTWVVIPGRATETTSGEVRTSADTSQVDAAIQNTNDALWDSTTNPVSRNKTVQTGGNKKPRGKTEKPAPTAEELAFKARCIALQARINEWRGYELVDKGPLINERKRIKDLAQEYSDATVERIRMYLFNRHWKWSKPDNRFKIGAQILWEESKSVLQILQEEEQKQNRKASPGLPSSLANLPDYTFSDEPLLYLPRQETRNLRHGKTLHA